MTCNLEQNVKVQLTDFGKFILDEYYDGDYKREKENIQSMKIGKYYRMPFYLLFEIFGEYVYRSHFNEKGPFEFNVIEVEESR